MLPEVWGPPHWNFFHTFAEHLRETSYSQIGPILFQFFFRVCRHLPCPDCSAHAVRFLGKVNTRTLRTKSDLKNLMYVFHNFVNKRKNKSMFSQMELENTYRRKNIVHVFQRFLHVFNTRGNMNLLSESFQRDFVIRDLKKWFRGNFQHFLPPQIPPLIVLPLEKKESVDVPLLQSSNIPLEATEEKVSLNLPLALEITESMDDEKRL
jgi:hypothetical protein